MVYQFRIAFKGFRGTDILDPVIGPQSVGIAEGGPSLSLNVLIPLSALIPAPVKIINFIIDMY